MTFKLLLSVLVLVQSTGPAFAEPSVNEMGFVSEVERIVNQGAGAVASGAEDVRAAGQRALSKLRSVRPGDVIDVAAVKAATRHALARAGAVLSDVEFERLFIEQSKIIAAQLIKGELGFSLDELTLGQKSGAVGAGFQTIALACISNTLSTGVCVAAGGVAVIVGIVIIVRALGRTAEASR